MRVSLFLKCSWRGGARRQGPGESDVFTQFIHSVRDGRCRRCLEHRLESQQQKEGWGEGYGQVKVFRDWKGEGGG